MEPPWAVAQRRTGADGFFEAQRPRGAARKPRRRRARRGKKLAATVSNGVDPPVGLTPTAREKWSRTTMETAALQRHCPFQNRPTKANSRESVRVLPSSIAQFGCGRTGRSRSTSAIRHQAVCEESSGYYEPEFTICWSNKGANLAARTDGLAAIRTAEPAQEASAEKRIRVFRFPVSSRCPSESNRPWLGRRASPAWLRSEGKHLRYRASLPRARCL